MCLGDLCLWLILVKLKPLREDQPRTFDDDDDDDAGAGAGVGATTIPLTTFEN